MTGLLLAACPGSELNLAVEAAKELEKDGKVARVVSMVSWELFDEQDAAYKESVLPKDITARVRPFAPPCFSAGCCACTPGSRALRGTQADRQAPSEGFSMGWAGRG